MSGSDSNCIGRRVVVLFGIIGSQMIVYLQITQDKAVVAEIDAEESNNND